MTIWNCIVVSLGLIWGLWLPLGLVSAQTRVYIDIDQAGGYLLPLALPRLLGESVEPQVAAQLRQVLRQDLEISGLFRIIDPAAYIDPAPQGIDVLRYDNWAAVGALGVVAGRLQRLGNTPELLIQLVLHDVVQSQHQLASKEYRAQKTLYREVAHRFSDVVFRAFTGESSPFDTQVVCVQPHPDHGRRKDIILIDYDGHGMQRLVADGALNLSPVISPTGQLVAYTSYRDGAPNIYVRDMFNGKEERITSGSGLALPGSWSSDGRYLALSQTQNGNNDLFLYDIKRKRLRRLTTYWGIDVSPSFAPDNRRLVFTSDRSGSPQLYITDVQGVTPSRLTYEGRYNTSPVWSPHHNQIAFVGRSSINHFDIYTIDPDGRMQQRLTDGNGQYEAPTWAPDGRFLMYASQDGDRWQRLLMRSDGQGKRLLSATGPTCLAPQWITRIVR